MALDISSFHTGDDFIGFDDSASSAGPSRAVSPAPSEDEDNHEPTSSTNRNRGGPSDRIAAGGDSDSDIQDADKFNKRAKGKNPTAVPDAKRKKNEPTTGPRNLKEERKAGERAAPWADDVEWDRCADPAEMLNDEIHAFYNFMSPTGVEYEVRKTLIELITCAVHRSWPEAEVTPFGSWQTQLYLPTGDIDLVVSTPRLSEKNKARLLGDLAGMMRRARITPTVAVITKAKVPIIKFVTLEGNVNVDISLNQSNGVSAGKIMTHYLDALPGARELILVVKAFLSQRSMNEVYTGGLGSYSVICMVISFLQMHPKLRKGEINAVNNLGTLLLEFFELYGRNFNYDDVGISIREGGSYYMKDSRGWYQGAQPFLLSVEDPQDPENDISKSSFGIRQVKMTLGGAYDLLQAKLFERAAQVAAKRSRQLHEYPDSQEMSILNGVMGVTKETVKFRREIAALGKSGRLERQVAAIKKELRSIAPQRAPPSRARTPSPTKGGDDALNAILVEDDSDGPNWDSESASSEEGEIRPSRMRNRYESVSEDDVSRPASRASSVSGRSEASTGGAGDSRYGLGNGKTAGGKGKGGNGNGRTMTIKGKAKKEASKDSKTTVPKDVNRPRLVPGSGSSSASSSGDEDSDMSKLSKLSKSQRRKMSKAKRDKKFAAEAERRADAEAEMLVQAALEGSAGSVAAPEKADKAASRNTSRSTTPAATGPKVNIKDRQAFWAAKGLAGTEEEVSE